MLIPFHFNCAAACIQGLFKAQLRAFATALLEKPQKSKESEKETTKKELGEGVSNTLSEDDGPVVVGAWLRLALKIGQFVVRWVSKRLYVARFRYGIVSISG
jgi:hypothetical protein